MTDLSLISDSTGGKLRGVPLSSGPSQNLSDDRAI